MSAQVRTDVAQYPPDAEETGVFFHPLQDRWNLSPDMDVNYMLLAKRPA